MKISIIYFSGTGNTKLISEQMVNEFKRTAKTESISAEEVLKGRINLKFLDEDILLGIGFPIYDLSAPEIINKLVTALPQTKNPIPVFIFSTMAFIKGDSQSILAKTLKKKGYYTIGKADFLCPSNGVAIYEKKSHGRYKNVRFEKNVDKKIKEFVDDISVGYERFKLKPFHIGSLTLPVFNLVRYISDKLYGEKYYKDLRVSSNCIQCMACVNQCPDNNLAAENGKLKIINDNGCLRCLRCVANCPQKAINFTSSPRYGNYNKGMIETLYNEANQ